MYAHECAHSSLRSLSLRFVFDRTYFGETRWNAILICPEGAKSAAKRAAKSLSPPRKRESLSTTLTNLRKEEQLRLIR